MINFCCIATFLMKKKFVLICTSLSAITLTAYSYACTITCLIFTNTQIILDQITTIFYI